MDQSASEFGPGNFTFGGPVEFPEAHAIRLGPGRYDFGGTVTLVYSPVHHNIEWWVRQGHNHQHSGSSPGILQKGWLARSTLSRPR